MSASQQVILIEDEKPTPGTACYRCHELGHFCPAKHLAVDDPDGPDVALCQACVDCVECDALRARKSESIDPDPCVVPHLPKAQREETKTEIVAELIGQGMTVRQIAHECGYDRHEVKQLAEKIEPDIAGRIQHSAAGINEQTKQALLAEPATLSNTQLEQKYGVSAWWIGRLRRQHGIITPGMQKAAQQRAQKEPIAEEKAIGMFSNGYSARQVAERTGLSYPRALELESKVRGTTPPDKCGCGRNLKHYGRCAYRRQLNEDLNKIKEQHMNQATAAAEPVAVPPVMVKAERTFAVIADATSIYKQALDLGRSERTQIINELTTLRAQIDELSAKRDRLQQRWNMLDATLPHLERMANE